MGAGFMRPCGCVSDLTDVYNVGAHPVQSMFSQGGASREAFLGANACCINRPAPDDERQAAGAAFGDGTNKLILPNLDAAHAFR